MSGLDSKFSVAYNEKLQLGTGLHILSGKTAPASPFQQETLVLPAITKVARHAEFMFSKLRTTTDVSNIIDTKVKARAPVKGVPVAVTASYLREVKVSDTEMVSLIDTTYDTTEQVVPDNGPKFADEAEALLAADPKKFAERYGDYFVAGYSCRAHLTAMATHRSQDKEEMDKFALSVQAGLDEAGVKENEPVVDEKKPEPEAPGEKPAEDPKSAEQVAVQAKEEGKKDLFSSIVGKISAKVITNISKKTRDLRVETTIKIDYSGVQGVMGAVNLDQFAALVDQFKNNIAPVPLIAHLKTYKSVDSRCLEPGEHLLPQLSKKLTTAFTQVYTLQNVVLSSNYPEVSECQSILSDLVDQLSNMDAESQQEIDEWDGRFRSQKELVEKRLARRKFVDLVNEGYKTDRWPYLKDHKFTSAVTSTFESYRSGLRDDYLPPIQDRPALQFIKDEVVKETKSLRYENRLIPSQPVIKLPTNGGWVIGWELVNDRTDGHSGEAIVKQANRDGVEIEFHPDSLRDSNWTLHVFSLDRGLYHIQ